MASTLTGLIGRKLGMTQVYTAEGVLVPVTVIEAGPCTVVATRRAERDGYAAAQLGFGAATAEKLPKAMRGQFRKAGTGAFRVLREFRLSGDDAPAVGSELTVSDVFAAGELPARRVDRQPIVPRSRVQGQAHGRPVRGRARHHTQPPGRGGATR